MLVPGGKVAYLRASADGLRHFGMPGWAQVFRAFEAEPERDWAGEYSRSALCARYITEAGQAVPPTPRSRNRLAQLSTLARRYLAVIAADRNYVGVLALLPVILGGLVRAVPDPGGLAGPEPVSAKIGRSSDAARQALRRAWLKPLALLPPARVHRGLPRSSRK